MPPPATALSTADAVDERLGRRALAGDRDAFTELFGRHEASLFNISYRLTGSREDAADITQEAFLRVFARLDDLAGREVNLAAYLHRTARNLVYDRSGGRETASEHIEGVAGADGALDADPELSTLVSAQGEAVRAANARLPERHRLALALRELEDMSYDDIGRVLDITPGAVGQLLARARTALRRELRLGAVDVAAMDAACRGRLGDIGALIDGELGPDRAHVLSQHLELCPACRAARTSFEEARVTYRAWLPLPILGLGASTARAAEGRGLVRFSHSGRRAAALRRGAGGGSSTGGLFASRRRAAAMAGAGALGVILLFGAPTLVAIRSGSTPAPPSAPPLAAGSTTSVTNAPTAAPSTTAPATGAVPAAPPGSPTLAAGPATIAPSTSGGLVAPPARSRGARTPAAPSTTGAPPPASVAGTVATPVSPPADPPATTVVPPATTREPPPPTTTREPPPPTTTTTREPPPVTDPPPTRTDPFLPNDPPPRDDPPVF